jgi:hypothetical protein
MIQNLLSLLPVLACPVGMGLMMWFLMRMGREQSSSDATVQEERRREVAPENTPQIAPPPPLWKAIWDCMQMCLNWKVLVGLAAVVLLVGVVAPGFFWSAIPLLVVLVCPLSMIVMLFSMRSRQGNRVTSCSPGEATPAGPPQMQEQPDRERSSTTSLKW